MHNALPSASICFSPPLNCPHPLAGYDSFNIRVLFARGKTHTEKADSNQLLMDGSSELQNKVGS